MNTESNISQKPVLVPIQIIQTEDGYIEIFEKNMIGLGSGKAPVTVKET